ncbi:DEAD/DEAH box helicase [Nocardia jiangsuensis]|uniref:DEAD/DEAH box helicase n=1 Tax=Nocardia jiangsuensis TaxID=1691563 RepID=A0ABV8DXU2_9NOCA
MLHALWSPGAGLLLWRDERPGAEPPEPLGGLLARARFRHRAEALQPTGAVAEVPAHALAPAAAAEVLRQRLPPETAAGDLRFLAHVANGIERWVRAGRVVPQLRRADGQWWSRWELVGGARQRAWSAELAALMPPALRVPGRPAAVLEDLLAELTDPIARSLLGGAPRSAHPLIAGLRDDEPVEPGGYRPAEVLERWRAGLETEEYELVLRLGEPDGDGGEFTLWRLEVCIRAADEAPEPVALHGDPVRLRTGMAKLEQARAAYPRLRDLPGDDATLDLLLPTEVVADLVEHGAAALHAAGIRLLLPRPWTVTAPTLKLRVSSPPAAESAVGLPGILSYRWELALGDTELTEAEMRGLITAESDLVRLRGEWVQADRTALSAAARYVAAQRGDEATLAALFAELARERVDGVPITEVTATGWAAELFDRHTETVEVPDPPGLGATLRPYQRRGLAWLATMSRLGLGAILADDMGLGKTVQVLALLLHERAATPTLLVCPMSVVGNWQRETTRFAPELRVLVHHGPARLSGAALATAAAGADLVITTYALLARDVADLAECRWERLVLDEAQHVKNAATRQARAARAVPARHRLALTGTPMENRLEELRALLDVVVPGLLGSAQAFRSRFAVPIEREADQNAVTRLRAITGPFVLRRVKTDPTVIDDLPEKLEMTVRANLTAEQAALYQAVLDDMVEKLRSAEGMARRGAVLAALTRLAQVCNHPAHFLGDGSPVLRRGRHRSGKLALLEDIVDGVLGDGEKALLFTRFREFGELVVPFLAERFGTQVPFLHGGVARGARDAMVERFQSADGPPLMVLSLAAGGTGLTLTAANHVVHMDRWWNPAVENQATDRAYRIGQRRAVQVRKLVCVDTLEERIDEMIAHKRKLADLTVGVGENWVTELGTDELRDLFALGAEAVGE